MPTRGDPLAYPWTLRGHPRPDETMRKFFLSLLPLVLIAACGEPSAKKPNVILITLDTTRADFLSCYGVHPGVTPNLDALAAEGTRFDMAISGDRMTLRR